MDPTATLRWFLFASQERDRDSALETLNNLLDWIKQGGDLPEVSYDDGDNSFILERNAS